jgi:hypothetical protein
MLVFETDNLYHLFINRTDEWNVWQQLRVFLVKFVINIKPITHNIFWYISAVL